MQFDSSEKVARKKTYSKKKPKKKESLLASDDEEPDFSNVEALLKDDNETDEEESQEAPKEKKSEAGEESADKQADAAKGTEEDENAVDPAVAAAEEREAIKEARRTIGLDTDEKEEEEYTEPVRRSRRQKKKTPKMKLQEAAMKSKKSNNQTNSKPKSRRSSTKSKNTKTRKADIREVSEGEYIRLFWEPTGTWSNGIVTRDWGDGYFTIQFEDDVKEQGALSYKLADYDWFIVEDAKSTARKSRKRKRNKDVDYEEAPVKKQRVSAETNSSAKNEELQSLQAETAKLKDTISRLEKEKSQYEGEKKEITKMLDTIVIKDFESTTVMEKLKHILQSYAETTAED